MISRREFGRLVAAGAAAASLGTRVVGPATAGGTSDEVVIAGPRHDWLLDVERSADQVRSRTGLRLVVRYLDHPVAATDDIAGADLVLLPAGAESRRALDTGLTVDLGSVVRAGRLDLSARTDFERALATTGPDPLPGVPFVSDDAVVYHRPDLPAALGGRLPESFDDLVAAAYQLTDDERGVGGLAILDEVSTIAPVLYSFGGFVADEGAIGLSSIENMQAYATLQRLVTDCSGGNGPVHGWEEAVDRFVAGGARFLLAGGGLRPLLAARCVGEDVRATPLPSGPTGTVQLALPTWVVALSASSGSEQNAVRTLQALVDVAAGLAAGQEGALRVESLDAGNPGTDPRPGFSQEATQVDAAPEALVAALYSAAGRDAVVAPMLSEDVSSAQAASEDLLVRALG